MTAVGIVGAGAIACGCAAFLTTRGHAPVLWSPSGRSTAGLDRLQAAGAVETECAPGIAGSAEALCQGAEVILLALPLNGHRAAMEAIAPHLEARHTVLISSHGAFGALYLSALLARRGLAVPIVAMGTTVLTGRRNGDHVQVNTVRQRIDICVVPEGRTEDGRAVCEALFGERFVLRDGLIAITLSNLNPQNHMGIALANMARMEHGETWNQGANVTPNVGRLLEALDAERLEIAQAFGCETRTIFEHFHLSFHVPEGPVAEMNRQMAEAGRGGTGPATADSRYVTEDVPFGLVTTVRLARRAGREAPLHEAGVRIFSAMYGRDFAAENDLLDGLGFDRLSRESLERYARDGAPAGLLG